MNLEQLVDRAQFFDKNKFDVTVNARDGLAFTGNRIALPEDLFGNVVYTEYDMEDWALQQACNKLGVPPYRYISQCPPVLVQKNLEYWQTKLPQDRKWMLRTHEGSVRAIVSDQYVPIPNTKVLRWVDEFTGRDYPLVRPYLDRDTMHLKVKVLGNTDDGNYGYGVYIGNGETGNRSLRVCGFIQRHICENSIVLLKDGLIVRHIHITVAEARAMVKLYMGRALNLAVEARDAIAKAEEERMPDLADVVRKLCKRNGLSEQVQDSVMMGTEGSMTRMGLVNGLSWAAHQQEDQDLAIDLETLAGGILVGTDTLFGQAGRVFEQAEMEI